MMPSHHFSLSSAAAAPRQPHSHERRQLVLCSALCCSDAGCSRLGAFLALLTRCLHLTKVLWDFSPRCKPRSIDTTSKHVGQGASLSPAEPPDGSPTLADSQQRVPLNCVWTPDPQKRCCNKSMLFLAATFVVIGCMAMDNYYTSLFGLCVRAL